MHRVFLLCLAALLPTAALAFGPDDLEYNPRWDIDPQTGKKLVVMGGFEAEWHAFNNLDFRGLDESSDQSILDSDDRSGLAYTGINLGMRYKISDKLQFRLDASYRGFWGGDSFGNTNQFGGWIYFPNVNIDYKPFGDDRLRIRFGRQSFRLGGQAGSRDFIMADIIDAIRVDVQLGSVGSLVLIPVDVFTNQNNVDDATFAKYIARNDFSTYNFRGQLMTTRHGGMFVLDGLDAPFEARAYGFYTNLGGMGSGSDISYNGSHGNFIDRDWVVNMGARVELPLGVVTPWASFDASLGIDRKEEVAKDVKADGYAFSGGVLVVTGDADKGLRAGVSYFQSMGPAYGSDGLQYSHGYVGMKGQHIGGMLTNRYFGMHPTSYTGGWGQKTTPNEVDRASGTRVLSAGAIYEGLGPVSLGAGYWFLQDTGVSFVDFDNLDSIVPPYGYSRQEFAATERLGRVLGHEIDLLAAVQATDEMHFEFGAAVLLPGEFYAIDIAREAGAQLGGDDMTWAVNAGMEVQW